MSSKNDGFFRINKQLTIIGAVLVIVAAYLFAATLIPGQTNTINTTMEQWAKIKADPFHFYFNGYTPIAICVALFAYMIFVLYVATNNKTTMPGREYGGSCFANPASVTKKIANSDNSESNPLNIVIYYKKQNRIKNVITKFVHRNDE